MVNKKEINELKEQILSLRKLLAEERGNSEKLRKELLNVKANFGKQLRDLQRENERKLRAKLNAIILEGKQHASKEEWEKIIDEMAHSINSDVFAAVSFLSGIKGSMKAKNALNHTLRIRDLINLIMTYLKRNEIVFSGKFTSVSIEEQVKEQIFTIKNSLTTLRLSEDEHEESLKKIKVPVEVLGDSNILVFQELKEAIPLIIKDLLRNAFKNTDEENPQVSVKIQGEKDFVRLEITNNKTISEAYSKWFNGETVEEPDISKSSKVGLRVILKWTKELKITARLERNSTANTTTAILIFPKEITYEKET